jgi:hypothetical protein
MGVHGARELLEELGRHPWDLDRGGEQISWVGTTEAASTVEADQIDL